MANWHVAGVDRGTKGNIIYHAIMFVFFIICLLVAGTISIYLFFEEGFNIGSTFASLIILFLVFMHKYSIKECTNEYVKTRAYRETCSDPNFTDKLIIYLVNYYNRKWKPAQHTCCSFYYLDPKVAYNSIDFTLIKNYGKKYDSCRCLYQCNKCHNYVFAIESAKDQEYAYIPIKYIEDAHKYYSKEWMLYSIRTTEPILRAYGDYFWWENKVIIN